MSQPFEITHITIPAPVTMNLALVCDLHNTDPAPALDALRTLQPDLIAIAGDLVQRDTRKEPPGGARFARGWRRWVWQAVIGMDTVLERLRGSRVPFGTQQAEVFLRQAVQIAPTFYAPGNHELAVGPEQTAALYAMGAVVLDNRWAAYNGIWLGGLSDGCDEPTARAFAALPGYKILLCHRPEYYPRLLQMLNLPLILSGHAHGGQIRLFGRGLFAPGQGLLPRYTSGLYDGRLLVSRGMSNTLNLPRLFNRCQLYMVHLRPDDSSES